MSNRLSKPTAKVKTKATKSSKKLRGNVIKEGTVEPLAGWTVGFQIIEDKTRTTEHNTDGRFVRFTNGIQWMPDRSVGTAYAYKAVVEAAFDD
jgi:hypothetical protein